MSYYHTHRPQQFADLIGQEPIVIVLKEALRAKRLAHAYLFAGERGTGKTTTARLLAKAVNCEGRIKNDQLLDDIEPCNDCSICQAINRASCLDVVEIDAASNRGIEEIRQLKEQIRFKPQEARKKVFIIDEVHMLTKEAFNALLKTLEEPPEELLFILATTEVHKLPATVISRCQRFDFQSPSALVISQYLERICRCEAIEASTPALAQIAQLAHGSFRDATTLLEQLAVSKKKVSLESVIEIFGLAPHELLSRYLASLAGQEDKVLLADLGLYFSKGGSGQAFLDQLFDELDRELKSDTLPGKAMLLLKSLVELKQQVKYSPISQLPLLAAVATSQSAPSHIASQLSGKEQPQKPKPPADIEPKNPALHQVEVAKQIPPAKLPATRLADDWQKTIDKLMEAKQSSLVAILRTAEPLTWQPPILRVAVQFKFHADQLTRQKNRAILESALDECFGCPVELKLEVQAMSDLAAVVEEIAL